MSDIAVKVENLSKMYHIGAKQEQYATLRSALVSGVKRLTTKRSAQEIEENNLWALKDVSFEIKQGDVVGIIGRNGAGKSTLLKVLAHITEPTKGRVSLYGRVGSLLEVGTGFHPELTGRDNIYLNGAILGMKRAEIERKFDEIVAFSEIERFLDTPVKRYSSGMYVRLAFAVAAHLEPEILVVDEVLAVGDVQFQKKCLGKMGDVAKEGRTVLFVSHNIAAIKNICQRALLVQKGSLVLDGMPGAVISEYISDKQTLKLSPRRSLENAVRTRGSLEAKIMEIFSLDKSLNLKSQFSVWEPIIFKFSVRAEAESRSISAWVLIYSSDGEVILSGFQSDDREDISIDTHQNTISVILEPLFLTPGRYSVSVGLFGKQREFYDWIDNALVFEILPEFFNGKPYDARLGKTVGKFVWQFNG